MRSLWVWLLATISISSLGQSWAQPNATEPTEKPGVVEETPAEEEAAQNPGRLGQVYTSTLPKEWSIKQEVSTLENSLNSYDPLIQNLDEAHKDLRADLEEYLRNPDDQVVAARITMKMSSYAKKIVWDFDKVISNQDVMLSVFKELEQKLTKFSSYLDYKVTEIDEAVKQYEVKDKALRRQLALLAAKIKETPDEKLKEQYTREFQKIFRQYNLNTRYKEGHERHKNDYETLARNLKALVKVFNVLHDAFGSLVENLEAEKGYLLDNIRLQADAIRVQKLVHEGISDGHRAVKNISEKLALLYAKVDGFAKVHEKINRDLARFVDSQKILLSVTKTIEEAPLRSAPSLEKAIDYFYTNRDKE